MAYIICIDKCAYLSGSRCILNFFFEKKMLTDNITQTLRLKIVERNEILKVNVKKAANLYIVSVSAIECN